MRGKKSFRIHLESSRKLRTRELDRDVLASELRNHRKVTAKSPQSVSPEMSRGCKQHATDLDETRDVGD